jgi:hypothetical protein
MKSHLDVDLAVLPQAQSVEAQKMWVKNIVEATSATATASNSSVPGK